MKSPLSSKFSSKKTRSSLPFFARLWQGFLNSVGPKAFFSTFEPWVFWCGWAAAVLLVSGSFWGLFVAPIDAVQGESYRIIYIHVPAASLALSLYVATAILAIIHLVWKIKVAEYMVRATVLVGWVFCILALITGAIWGKPTWGTYWVWDARLTSMLILAFLYFGLLILLSQADRYQMSVKPALILSIIGVINLPIIKYSVVWVNTLHQTATFTLTQKPKMSPEMYWPLLITLLGGYILTMALVIYHTNTQILRRESQSAWVAKYIAGKVKGLRQ